MEDEINELIHRAIISKLQELSKEKKLIIKKGNKSLATKSTLNNIQIKTITKNEICWSFTGILMLEIFQQGETVSLEEPYSFSCDASILLKFDEKQQIKVDTLEIIDNTIHVNKIF